MTTDYDPIAEQYQRSKQQPWRTFIECFTLLELVGDVASSAVMDVACGEGFYTRLLRQRGAASATGVDLSSGMIELARSQEAKQQLGIEYIVGDARALPADRSVDLVVAAYLLNYARDPDELSAMCNGIARSLKPGGRFVTVNSSPLINFSEAPCYRQYGFETTVTGPWTEGAPIEWKFYLNDSAFTIENYYLSPATHEAAFDRAGFRNVHWHAPKLSAQGTAEHGAAYWDGFLRHPPITFIECIKG
jgi:toxoflavin synthase